MGNASGSVKQGEAVLLQPSMEGDLDKVKELVGTFLASYSHSHQGYFEPGSDPNLRDFVNQTDPQGNNAIHGAVFAGHLDIVKYLDSCGASLDSPNAIGCSPTWLAAGYDRVHVLSYLLAKVANQREAMLQTNSTGDTPILAASSRGNLGCCEFLLDQAAALSTIAEMMGIPNKSGDLPIHVAIASVQTSDQLLDFLLDHTDDQSLKLPNNKGLTPLLLASERDNVKLVQKLLDRHVDKSQCDASGASAMAIAAFCGSKQVLALLLELASSDLLEKPNKNGCTPLWLATRSGRSEIVEMLLNAGADPAIENNDRISSIGAATKYKRDRVLEIFNAQE